MFDEMPLAEDGIVMSMEGYAATTQTHMLDDEYSQQTNHELFADEQSDATTFSSLFLSRR